MSKNLETEYKNLINTDIPDLWARIEAALPEKNIQNGNATVTSGDNLINYSTGNVNSVEDPVQFRHIKKSYNDQLSGKSANPKKKRKKFNYALWSGVAVACIAVGILIPVLISTKKADKESERERVKAEDSITWSTTNAETAGNDSNEYTMEAEETSEAVYEETYEYDSNDNAKTFVAAESQEKDIESTSNAVKSESTVSTERFKAVVDIAAIMYDEENELSYYGVVLVPNGGLESGEHVILYPAEEKFEHYQELQEIEMVLQYVETTAYGEKAFIICDVLTVK